MYFLLICPKLVCLCFISIYFMRFVHIISSFFTLFDRLFLFTFSFALFCYYCCVLFRWICIFEHVQSSHQRSNTQDSQKKNTLSNPREIKRGKSSNLTNKLFCPILLLFSFEPGSQHRAISAKQSEYKWVEGVDDGLEGEGICKS